MIKGLRLFIVMAVALLFAGFFAWWIHTEQQGHDLVSYLVSVVGFLVAFLALYIAVATYASIDSVDAISKMEGNILDNENYVTSVPELIQSFNVNSGKALEDELFRNMEIKLLKYSGTTIKFADTLQYLVDLVVLFPAALNAFETDRKTYAERMDASVKLLDRKAKALLAITQGNSIQIKETIKLFKGVVSYQSHVADGSFNVNADLLLVRGSILRNPVTKTVFHNYLGLYYNKKAMHLIRTSLALDAMDLLSLQGIRILRKLHTKVPPDTREKILMYLDTACVEFTKAMTACGDDLMWPGFIRYNQGRTEFFKSTIFGTGMGWLQSMDAAIVARVRLNGLIDEVLGDDVQTHLRTFFAYQEELARLVKVNMVLGSANAQENPVPPFYRGIDLANIAPTSLEGYFVRIASFHQLALYQDALLLELA